MDSGASEFNILRRSVLPMEINVFTLGENMSRLGTN
jgi:hypothetical protein